MEREASRGAGERTREAFRPDLGASWLSLISTVRGRWREHQSDLIATPAQLGGFLAAFGQAPRARPTADDLAFAHELREALYALARAQVGGPELPRSAAREINAALALDAPLTLSAGTIGRPADARVALARITRQAIEDVAGADRPRLRACGDDTCATIFVDESGRRRYCNDAWCGTRVRVQAHRARRRAAREAGAGDGDDH